MVGQLVPGIEGEVSILAEASSPKTRNLLANIQLARRTGLAFGALRGLAQRLRSRLTWRRCVDCRSSAKHKPFTTTTISTTTATNFGSSPVCHYAPSEADQRKTAAIEAASRAEDEALDAQAKADSVSNAFMANAKSEAQPQAAVGR